eukprot:11287607-Ditylum_brightwellii.AAC.1
MDLNPWSGDKDIGEMFLNYPLHQKLQPYAGVDLAPTGLSTEQGATKGRWARLLFEMKPSPFLSMRTFLCSEEIIHGNCLERSNPLRWDSIRQNLPGSPLYNFIKSR